MFPCPRKHCCKNAIKKWGRASVWLYRPANEGKKITGKMPSSECTGVQAPWPHYPRCACICTPTCQLNLSVVSVSPALAGFFAPWHLAAPPPQTRNAVPPRAGVKSSPLCVSQVVLFSLVASLRPAAGGRCWHRAALTSVLLRALPSISLAEGAHGGRRWLG